MRELERLHLLVGRAVNMTFKFLARRRMHPRARAGWGRAEGRFPADAPLPETPARNLPPEVECSRSAEIDAYHRFKVPPLGLEPRTCGLKVRSSTN